MREVEVRTVYNTVKVIGGSTQKFLRSKSQLTEERVFLEQKVD